MRKIVLLILIVVCPLVVYAEEETNDFITVDSISKFYKTVIIYNETETLAKTNNDILSYSEEITEEEYNNIDIEDSLSINNSTSIETTYKKMTTTISSNGSYYRYKVSLDWKIIPSVRSYDVIAIGHYASVKPYSSVVFTQKYCTSSSSCTTSTSATINTTSTGTGAVFKVPTDTLTSLTQTLYFDVQKNTTSTIISQKAVGDYAHATQSVSKSTATLYNVSLSGITFSSTTISGYYDSITEAIATWSGSW